jgi:hypothetical protein
MFHTETALIDLRSGDALAAGITRGQRVDDRATLHSKNEQYGITSMSFRKPHGTHRDTRHRIQRKIRTFRKPFRAPNPKINRLAKLRVFSSAA